MPLDFVGCALVVTRFKSDVIRVFGPTSNFDEIIFPAKLSPSYHLEIGEYERLSWDILNAHVILLSEPQSYSKVITTWGKVVLTQSNTVRI